MVDQMSVPNLNLNPNPNPNLNPCSQSARQSRLGLRLRLRSLLNTRNGLVHFTLLFCLLSSSCSATDLVISDENPLQLPLVGAHQLRVLAPTILELTLITTKK